MAYEPEPLIPLQAPRHVQASSCKVKGPGGHSMRHRVLQQIPSSSSSSSSYDHPAYAIESTITMRPKTGVFLLLAYRYVWEEVDSTSPCLARSGGPLVIKAVPKPGSSSRLIVDDPTSEIAALQILNQHTSTHRNVVRLLDCMQDERYIYLVLPYLSGGDMFSLVESKGKKGLPTHEVAGYFRQICEG